MIEVQFNDVDEFIEELRRDAALVDRKIVRLTKRWQLTGLPYQRVSVIGGALVEGRVIRLRAPCGDDFGEGVDETKKTHELAERNMAAVEAACKELGLEVRAGRLQEGGAS